MADLSSLRDRILHEPAGSHFRDEVTLPKAVELTFAPGQIMTLSFKPDEISREAVAELVTRLDGITLADRAAFEEPLWTFYCQEMVDGAGNFDSPQAQLDWEADFDKRRHFSNPIHATRPEEVWPLVCFTQLRISRGPNGVEALLGGCLGWGAWHHLSLR